MKIVLSKLTFVALALAGSFAIVTSSRAQVAGGTTTIELLAAETTQLAMGWSVKKSLLGKSVYNDAGEKVGKVDDLIISPDKNVSYVIVGAGGFIGMGRHDVAVPVTRVREVAGKLVMSDATKDTIKSMPEFTYATDGSRRDQFVAAADKDIAKGKAKVADLEKKAAAVTTDARAKILVQANALQLDVTSAQAKVTEMKDASVVHWRDFEAGVNAATARLRKAIDAAAG